MRLTRYTDYAMRVLFYLAVNPGRPVPVSEIARAYDISQNHLVKIVHDLVKAGYLTSTRGRSGGVALARPAQEIRLGELVRCTETDLQLVDCLGCAIIQHCSLPNPLHEATAAFLGALDRYTLADIIATSGGIERVLGRAA